MTKNSLDPSWVTLAYEEMGVAEVAGAKDNPRIMEYFRACGPAADWVKHDETPWCAAFVGWLMHNTGHPLAPEPLRARSWLDWGDAVSKPYAGCVVVLRRGKNPAEGHVGLLYQISADKRSIYVLGGNQGNRVSVVKFPVADVLGYRVPPGYRPPGVVALTKRSRIAKDARDLVAITGVGGAAKAVSDVVPPPPATVTQSVENVSLWQTLFDQGLSLVQFVGRNFAYIAVALAIVVAVRIVYWRWQDHKTGKTGEM